MLRQPHPQDALPPLELDVDPDSAFGVTDDAHERARALALDLTAEGWARIDVRSAGAYPETRLEDTDIVGAHVLTEVWARAWYVELLRAVVHTQRSHAWVGRMFERATRNLELRASLLSIVRALPPLEGLEWDHPRQLERAIDRTGALQLLAFPRSPK